MSDDSDDAPLTFPHSEPDYYPEVVENDEEPTEPEESTQIWQPECLQIMKDHGLSPEDFENVSEEESEEPEVTPVHARRTTNFKIKLPASKPASKAGGASHDRRDISKVDAKKLSVLDAPASAKRKKHELWALAAESDLGDSDTNEDTGREAALQGGEMKKPPKKKARGARHDVTGEAEAGQQASTEDLEQPENPVQLEKKCKRGRLRKSAEETAARLVATVTPGSPPFNASVFSAYKLIVRGKTQRSDKHVAQEPRVAGPFTLVRSMKWAEFLDEVAECVRELRHMELQMYRSSRNVRQKGQGANRDERRLEWGLDLHF